MFKVIISLCLLAVAMTSGLEYIAAPALYPRYAAPYIAPLSAVPLALATPYAYNKLALPAASGYSQYSSVATPNSYSEQYRSEQKPLPYSAIIY